MTKVTTDANKTPKANEITIGIKNWAWALRSNKIGNKPAKVVKEVSTIGRKRSVLAFKTDSKALYP